MVDFLAVNIGAGTLVAVLIGGFQIYIHRGRFEREYNDKVDTVLQYKRLALRSRIRKLCEMQKQLVSVGESAMIEITSMDEAKLIEEIGKLGNEIDDCQSAIVEGKSELATVSLWVFVVGFLWLIGFVLGAYEYWEFAFLPLLIVVFALIQISEHWSRFHRISKELDECHLEVRKISSGNPGK
jgi:hypothetical protein